MHNLEIIILLLSIISILSVIAEKLKVPYPILLVLVGLAIGFIPGLPLVELNPNIVFLIFLPPLLFSGAWTTSWNDFKGAMRPITLLAIGCVLFTTTGVAIAAHFLIPDFSWPLAFLLGAIVSPPDAVAASSITKNLGISRLVTTILEGESLINDASGLIAYRYALTAVATGNFIIWEAGLQFFIVAIVGTAIGLLVGYIMAKVFHFLPDSPTVETSLSLLTPFMAYLLAENFHFSGVLAVVSCGLYLSWRSSEIMTFNSRLQSSAVWNLIVFILNGLIFILIGLQLPVILKSISNYPFHSLLWYGFAISITVVLVRILWVIPGTYVPRIISKKIRLREQRPNWRSVFIVAWTGMRGVVSLAAALALPVRLSTGTPFPHRDLIIFLTFCVILFTLVFQGLSLPVIIRFLGLKSNNNEEELEEIEARKRLAAAAIEHIEENFSLGVLTEEVLSQIKNKYELRYNHLNNFSNLKDDTQVDSIFESFNKIQNVLLTIERKELIVLRKVGNVNEEVLRKLEYELDLEQSRLSAEKIH